MHTRSKLSVVRLAALFILPLVAFTLPATASPPNLTVEAIGMTVSDLDRAVDFYSHLTFRKISDVEVFGPGYEHFEGVFGARLRIVRMQLGSECIDLTQYLFPPGRPIPADSRSNDR